MSESKEDSGDGTSLSRTNDDRGVVKSPGTKGFRIEFQPLGLRGDFEQGLSILDCARLKGVDMVSLCGGTGTCGKCRVQVIQGEVSELQDAERDRLAPGEISKGCRLACRAFPKGDLVIHIPPESLSAPQRLKVEGDAVAVTPEPETRTVGVTVPAPSITDLRGDDQRLMDALARHFQVDCSRIDESLALEMPDLLRSLDWKASVTVRGPEIIALAPAGSQNLGVAVDLGTTKVAGYLVELETGRTLSARGIMNPQIAYGEDVASRLTYAGKSRADAQTLQEKVVTALNGLFEDLCRDAGVPATRDIHEVVIAGNTAMHHLLLGLSVDQLAKAPHVPAVAGGTDVKCRHLGLKAASGAYVHLLPNIAGYVGGDHVAMLLTVLAGGPREPAIALDIGTNTEISLITRGGILSVSCASGPAFEGAHITCGMRAAVGAIDHVLVGGDGIQVHTIEEASPAGICGSGIFDALAGMLSQGIVDKGGRILMGHALVRERNSSREFVLTPETENGGHAVVISQKDVRELQLAKGAIRAGMDILLKEAGLSYGDVLEILVAGAFGSYLDLSSAVKIGMLPDLPPDRFRQIGNAAGVGARAALVSRTKREEARNLARRVRYVEIAADADFQQIFMEALLLGQGG